MMKCLVFLLIIFKLPIPILALCTHCHRDSSHTKIYRDSPHGQKGVECSACHVDRNILQNIADKITGLATFSFKKTHLGTYAKDENCLTCHRAIRHFNYMSKEALPEKLKDIGLTINHERHIGLRTSCRICHASTSLPSNPAFKFIQAKDPMGCASCHRDIAHVSLSKYDYNFPMEDQCGYCHGKDRKCPALSKISDVKDKSRCTECHPNQYSL